MPHVAKNKPAERHAKKTERKNKQVKRRLKHGKTAQKKVGP